MGKRRRRAEAAIDEVQDRARDARDTLMGGIDETTTKLSRRVRKGRKRIDRSAREAERKLGHFWNRGRLRVRRLRKRAGKRIDRVVEHSQR